MSDLAERLKGVIEEKLAIARTAGDGDMYTVLGSVDLEMAQRVHIAAHDPAWAIRQHEAALRVLERHRLLADHPEQCCAWCREFRWPCVEVRDLADAYGVPVDTEEETRG